MTVLPLVYSPDPLLKKVSKPVKEVDDAMRIFMDDMLETMYASNGIGLAAVQVGKLLRILVMDVAHGSERYKDEETNESTSDPIFIINPEIIEASEELFSFDEGCLSFPEQYAAVERPAKVKVQYLGYDGREKILEAEGLLAVCVQHEIDHLNGITFVDHISKMKRDMILRKMKKRKKMEA